jgi:hypothetical protein
MYHKNEFHTTLHEQNYITTVYSLIIHVRVMIIDFNHHRLQQTLKYPCSAILYQLTEQEKCYHRLVNSERSDSLEDCFDWN